ncbi:hypothetical protein TNCV_1203951 [Trichonephila clavipes]|nr:hypothetical protein TNCV_1203951 [Trichonephila clavipes]
MRMNSHNRLDNFLRWRAVGRAQAGQSQVEMAESLQGARKFPPGGIINSKQEVLSPGRSSKVSTEQHLHRIVTWFLSHADICIQRLHNLLVTLLLCLEEEFPDKRS